MNSDKFYDVQHWYAIHTKPRQEDRADSNLRAWRIETFTPKLKEYRYNQLTGEQTFVIKHLFPQYIFARFNADTLLHKIHFTRGVHRVIGFGNSPTPINDEIIDIIRSRMGANGFVRIGEELRSGDEVVIKDGLLKNFIGIFERQMGATNRVRILLTAVTFEARIVVERQLVEKTDQYTHYA